MDEDITKIDRLLNLFPLYSEDLGIDISKPLGQFKQKFPAVLDSDQIRFGS